MKEELLVLNKVAKEQVNFFFKNQTHYFDSQREILFTPLSSFSPLERFMVREKMGSCVPLEIPVVQFEEDPMYQLLNKEKEEQVFLEDIFFGMNSPRDKDNVEKGEHVIKEIICFLKGERKNGTQLHEKIKSLYDLNIYIQSLKFKVCHDEKEYWISIERFGAIRIATEDVINIESIIKLPLIQEMLDHYKPIKETKVDRNEKDKESYDEQKKSVSITKEIVKKLLAKQCNKDEQIHNTIKAINSDEQQYHLYEQYIKEFTFRATTNLDMVRDIVMEEYVRTNSVNPAILNESFSVFVRDIFFIVNLVLTDYGKEDIMNFEVSKQKKQDVYSNIDPILKGKLCLLEYFAKVQSYIAKASLNPNIFTIEKLFLATLNLAGILGIDWNEIEKTYEKIYLS